MSAKWTRGEVRGILADKDADAALEVLRYLYDRGPSVVAWDDERGLCATCEIRVVEDVACADCEHCDAMKDAPYVGRTVSP